ncbi:uncharacterized protein DEA37_0009172 [Paragonimus westermani]|uniref:Uncharacterized protein n=1 Tax=Paragonimus westermani TaxID=34504 RepID=A0A5J4NZN5_9TREM|nr:uncharacterized protein DEA37_0009172 [Paragonimus westermani]
MPINPALKLKLDELFLRWLTDPATQKVLNENLVQLKANEPLQTMLAVPSGVVVGPMSSSVYGFFYSTSCESPGSTAEGMQNGLCVSGGTVGSLVSPRPNTPPYFPQPPHSKMFSPRSPRRHLSGVGTTQTLLSVKAAEDRRLLCLLGIAISSADEAPAKIAEACRAFVNLRWLSRNFCRLKAEFTVRVAHNFSLCRRRNPFVLEMHMDSLEGDYGCFRSIVWAQRESVGAYL